MVPNGNTTTKKAPTFKDSRFHNNNTSQSIKALERYQEKGIITKDDAQLIDEYLVVRVWFGNIFLQIGQYFQEMI